MNVRELIMKLIELPLDATVTIDTDDGMQRNFKEVVNLNLQHNYAGVPFVSLDADWGKNMGGS